MRRYLLLIAFILSLHYNNISADEGLWLLPLINKINITEMTKLGFKLSAEDIYDINNNSMKDAIVVLSSGCTGEIISEDGLLLTNHHCAYKSIQSHSTVEHDYLQDGFWAFTKEEELPNPELSVKFLIRIEDVSERINSELSNELSEDERVETIFDLYDEIEEEATEDNHYKAEVKSFFGGNYFYLFIYEVFTDVRLVGAPPSSVGKFGYDTDNWMWPRHTGDFSLLRVYCGPDGKPSDYSEDNVPYKPRYFLPISLKGFDIGDFAMVIGYPGSTERYMTSFGVKEVLEITHPNRIKIRGVRQDILLEDMMKDQEIRIQYASKYSRSSNYWKFSIGQSQGLKKLQILDRKKELENEFMDWIAQDEQRQEKYGQALELIEDALKERRQYLHARQYLYESFFRASEIMLLALRSRFLNYQMLVNKDNNELIDSLLKELKEFGDGHFADYNTSTDMKVTKAMIDLYRDNVPEEQHPEFYSVIKKRFNGNTNRFVEKMYRKSIFADKTRFNQFIQKPSAKILSKDPAFKTFHSVYNEYSMNVGQLRDINKSLERGRRLYISGLLEMQKDKKFYPDGNSTMRLTYGVVDDYFPRDAVHYNHFTTLKGVIEKEDSSNWEFTIPDKLKELYYKKDYDKYGIDDVMPVCFTTNNDITGGNSGSPVINSNGEIIGLAFDGNWEAMSGDVIFEPELQRCICVDIRYVLFIIEKFAGATHLIDELKLIN